MENYKLLGNHTPDLPAYDSPVLVPLRCNSNTETKYSKTSLRALRCFLASFSVLEIAGTTTLWSLYENQIPSWVYYTNIATTTVALCVLYGTCFCVFKPDSKQISRTQPENFLMPLPPNDTDTRKMLDELCERDPEGKTIDCSLKRVQEIVTKLSSNHHLKYLNAIPPYFITNFPPPLLPTASLCFTPLHYWARKGNLDVVSLLVINGAVDYFESGENSHELASSLYWSTLYGHKEVVEFLIKRGSSFSVAFADQNVLRYFIPKLIFEMSELIPQYDSEEDVLDALNCLKIGLMHLKKEDLKNLKLQLKIPIKDTLNCLGWLRWKYSEAEKDGLEFTRAQMLVNILEEFDNGTKALSLKELREMEYNVGTGITLYQESRMK